MITVLNMQESVVRKPTHKSLTAPGSWPLSGLGGAAPKAYIVATSGVLEFQLLPFDDRETLYASFGTAHEPITLSSSDQDFHRLKELWRKERGATSSITAMAVCPSYQRIVAMGKPIVPLILRELENEGDQPDMWFWAL